MTWGELKKHILDLGFDTDIPDGLITSCNRAIDIIMKTIVERYEKYFEKELSTDSYTWEIPTIIPITEETVDEFQLQVPDKLVDLVPLLAAHWAWLDDDVQKATIYWNEYDDLKNQLIQDMERARNYTIYDGFSMGW